ncbi:MAG TPA: class I SAM-dependent methyltransferase [Acidimicrobiales bacterium]|nr:class I SAM-dependent methyltransferase [Acidimicrobiales bacterium]
MAKDLRLYDAISTSYADTRRADPRIGEQICRALGGAASVVNIGAGTGNYEPTGRRVTAIEPSRRMIAGRPRGSPPVVQAAAEHLPLPSGAFDAAMAVLTVHHWTDWRHGLSEMRRVAARQVILLFEPGMIDRFWAMSDGYWPEAFELPSEREAIGTSQVASVLDVVGAETVPIPIDCTDGFGAAFWGRPEAYLDPRIQQGMSWLAQLPAPVRACGAARLEADLRSGEWDRRHGHLRHLDQLDVGYRLITARS